MKTRRKGRLIVRSIFETYKMGAGPSSSHSIGPERAARFFLGRLKTKPALIRVTLYGSLAATGPGHLTAQTLAAALHPAPCEVAWDRRTRRLRHPNTLRFEAFRADGRLIEAWRAYSVGGGNIEDDRGPVARIDPAVYPIRHIREAIAACQERRWTFWQFVEQNETGLWTRLAGIWRVMRSSVRRGLDSAQILLPGSLELPRRAPATWRQAQRLKSPQRDLAFLSAFALAAAEENANGSRVVTAPTCGSAGVLPGLLYYYETVKKTPRQQILQALATAGLFGSVIRANATVSGAEAGCQAEIGSACSMAAAAASQILGGSLHQIEYAAEIGMEHHLGLTCDPVEGYVQIPCIERNMTACLRAFECAVFSVLTDGRHLVSFDDVIDVMSDTGRDLQSAYRETARGGLALLWRKRVARDSNRAKIRALPKSGIQTAC